MSLPHLSDSNLIQIVDKALQSTALKSGSWLVCTNGCTQCCFGVFAINQLDALRLQNGMAELEASDPRKAARVAERVAEAVHRLAPEFPGDPRTGLLSEDCEAAFEDFANDEPCPVLDPETGSCDLYASRPMTCRVFGPPVRSEDGLGVCELCYHGATTEEIAACEMVPDPTDLESALLEDLERGTDRCGQTIIAFALGRDSLYKG